MAFGGNRPVERLIRWLGSLRLAVVLLSVLAAVLAWATIYEAKYGSEAARRAVYGAKWFDAVLVLLAINVAASAIVRFPWRPRLAGFLITHASILLILGGCLTTRWLGVTGRLRLAEGQRSNLLTTGNWVIALLPEDSGESDDLQVPIGQQPKPGRTVTLNGFGRTLDVKVLRYLPDSEVKEELIAGEPDDPPAVLVELQSEGHRFSRWLLADDQGRWAMRSAGFSLMASRRYVPPKPTATMPSKGTITATVAGKQYEVDVAEALAGPVPLADGKVTLQVKQYLERAFVDVDRKLKDSPERPLNPAVVVELNKDGRKEKRIVFARFGDISRMHSRGGTTEVKLAFKHPQGSAQGIRVVVTVEQQRPVLYEQNGEQLLQRAELAEGKPVQLKSLPWKLVLQKFLPHARPHLHVMAASSRSSSSGRLPAIEVEVASQGWRERGWLVWGQPKRFGSDGNTATLRFEEEHSALPFEIELNRFEIDRYPGTNMPAMYRSNVTVHDSELGEQRTVSIEMNRPLQHRGWSFFQSSYVVDRNRRISILSVSKDPGKPIVYWGFLLLVVGTVVTAAQRYKTLRPVNRGSVDDGSEARLGWALR